MNGLTLHCVKSVRIRSYSGPYSVRMRENTNQNNSEYGHFSGSVGLNTFKENTFAKLIKFIESYQKPPKS